MNLNEAIYEVIRTQFKKDMGEALKIVEGAGYEVTKWDGRFYVRNKKLNKDVCIREGHRGFKIVGNGYDKCKFGWDDVCRMDFVGYLNKPSNTEWYAVQALRNDWRSPTFYKYMRLRDARGAVEYNRKEIGRLRKQIADLHATLDKCVADRAERAQKLLNVRKELGLIK